MISVDIKRKNIYIRLENLGCIERYKVKVIKNPSLSLFSLMATTINSFFFHSFQAKKAYANIRVTLFFWLLQKGIMKYILFCVCDFWLIMQVEAKVGLQMFARKKTWQVIIITIALLTQCYYICSPLYIVW